MNEGVSVHVQFRDEAASDNACSYLRHRYAPHIERLSWRYASPRKHACAQWVASLRRAAFDWKAGRALRPQRNVLADGAVIVDADQGCTLMGVL